MGRTVVIGLDGVDWKLLQRFVEEGAVPNIAEVYGNGFHGDLRSIDPPVSVPAWICFFTGKKPDKIDLYNFLVRKKGSNEIFRDHKRFDYQRGAFWNLLENPGVVGVPSAYPTEEFNGFMVPGPFARNKVTENMENLVDEHGYEQYLPNMWQFDKSLDKLEKEIGFVDAVLEEKDPEFFMFTTSVPDRLQHSFWDDEDKMRELYKEMDKLVGRILEHFNEDDNVFIVSDHGFESLEKNFYLNAWLREEGFLSLKEGEESSMGREDLRYMVKKSAKDVLSRLGLLEFGIDAVPDSLTRKVQHSTEIWDKIDFPNTKAFAAANYVGEIYINKEEYENGCVPEEEFDDVRDEIIEKLKQVEDPETGEKVVENVWRKEEIYREHIAERAPDILFYTKDMKYKVKHDLHGKVFEEAVPVGAHGLNGIILGKGPDIRKGEFDMHLTDVAPTLLHLMGEKVPEDMDGEVQKQIFREGSNPEEREIKYFSEEVEGIDF